MKNVLFFALILAGMAYFSSCKKDTSMQTHSDTPLQDSVTNHTDTNNQFSLDTSLTLEQKNTIAQEVIELFNQDPSNKGIVIGTQDTSNERSNNAQWNPLSGPHNNSCPVAGQIEWYTLYPNKGKEYKANVHAVFGAYIMGLIVYDPNNPTSSNAQVIQAFAGNSINQPTSSVFYSKYEIPAGKELRLFVKSLSNLDYHTAVYQRAMKSHLRVNLSGWKHIYQKRLPVDYNDVNKFMNGQSSTYFPLYIGSAQYNLYSENLCGLASYLMARGIVGGLGNLSEIGNTKYNRACELAEARHRINYMINKYDMRRKGGYSLFHLFQYANGTQYFKGDYFDYLSFFGDCNGNGIYDGLAETCKAELTSPVGYNNAYNKVRNGIISGYPVIVGMIGNFSYHPSNPTNYITTNKNKGHHIVTIVGIDELYNGQKYVLYVDPYFDEKAIWQCEANHFFASMKKNGSGHNHSMLILKGH